MKDKILEQIAIHYPYSLSTIHIVHDRFNSYDLTIKYLTKCQHYNADPLESFYEQSLFIPDYSTQQELRLLRQREIDSARRSGIGQTIEETRELQNAYLIS